MLLTNQKIWALNTALNELLSDQWQLSSEFGYAAAYNKAQIQPFIVAIQASSNNNIDINSYNDARLEIINKFAELDEFGKAKIVGNNFVIKADLQEKFEDEIDELKHNYADIDFLIMSHSEELNKILNREEEVNLRLVHYSSLPDKLPGHLLAILFCMLHGEQNNV